MPQPGKRPTHLCSSRTSPLALSKAGGGGGTSELPKARARSCSPNWMIGRWRSFCMPSSPLVGLAEIYSFYGHPEGWGSGVAAALMAETLRNLHRNGYADVHLWTLKSTAQSRRFYTKCGFTESGAERTYDFGDGRPLEQLEYRRPIESR